MTAVGWRELGSGSCLLLKGADKSTVKFFLNSNAPTRLKAGFCVGLISIASN